MKRLIPIFVLGLSACGPATVDFTGTYNGVATYNYTNCSGTGSLASQNQTEEFDISQSGSTVSATAQGAGCTMDGSASGDKVTVASTSCPTFVDNSTNPATSITYTISGGSFSLSGGDLVIDVIGSANYMDSNNNDITCDVEISGSLPETS